MKFIQLSLLSLCAALVSAAPLLKRTGPSGSVAYPAGGTSFTSFGGILDLAIGYNTVNQSGNDSAQTISIDIALEPLNMPGDTVVVAKGYRGMTSDTPGSGKIQGSFSPSACGSYRLVITENQLYHGSLISFRAAAPSISIACVPIQ